MRRHAAFTQLRLALCISAMLALPGIVALAPGTHAASISALAVAHAPMMASTGASPGRDTDQGSSNSLSANWLRSLMQQQQQQQQQQGGSLMAEGTSTTHRTQGGRPLPRWRNATRLGRIPMVLWQTYRTTSLPEVPSQLVDSWRVLNAEAITVLHNDTQAARFINRTFSREVQQVYASFPLGVMRADFWRYAILYTRGGIYADVDVRCEHGISQWLPPRDGAADALPLKHLYNTITWDDCSLLLGLESDQSFCQWVIAGVARHPALEAVLQRIVDKALAAGVVNVTNREFVHEYTGPTIWTEAVLGLLRDRTSIDSKLGRSDTPRSVFDAVYSDPELFAEVQGRLGICLVGRKFVESQMVSNLYGSQKALTTGAGVHAGWQGWASWVEERQKLRGSSSPWERRKKV